MTPPTKQNSIRSGHTPSRGEAWVQKYSSCQEVFEEIDEADAALSSEHFLKFRVLAV